MKGKYNPLITYGEKSKKNQEELLNNLIKLNNYIGKKRKKFYMLDEEDSYENKNYNNQKNNYNNKNYFKYLNNITSSKKFYITNIYILNNKHIKHIDQSKSSNKEDDSEISSSINNNITIKNNNKINIENNNINNNDNINNIENTPIENATIIEFDNNEIIKYYLYPKIEFTEEEKNNSKVLLVIGQTGHGKTTFINALINIYLGITINDKFRYLLVQDENNQLDSKTKEITIYKIKPKSGLNFPPLIIIDTPGFGDTGGEKEDKKHLEKFREFFGSAKITNINCILYTTIGANSRFGENDKMIINYLLNLFSKNVKDNFVVGVTNCMPDSKKDIPNIINSLSDKDHFYYQNILKNDKLSRKEIIESDWYFTSDNKIISNNEIELNQMEKEKWKYMKIKLLIL